MCFTDFGFGLLDLLWLQVSQRCKQIILICILVLLLFVWIPKILSGLFKDRSVKKRDLKCIFSSFFLLTLLQAQILEFGLAVHEKFVPQDMRPLHKKLVDQFFVMKSSLGIQVYEQVHRWTRRQSSCGNSG